MTSSIVTSSSEPASPPALVGGRRATPLDREQPFAQPALSDSGRWRGTLHLRFGRRGARTVLEERRHRGPYLVQRPFYDQSGACQVYVIHPPGGIVGGDELWLSTQLDEGTHALLTAPAATKFYRSAGPLACSRIELEVGRGATLEWLPPETIVFAGANAETQLQVQLARDARLFAWDIVCLGRPACGEAFERGRFCARSGVDDARGPIWRERLDLAGAEPLRTASFGLRGNPVLATLLATLPGDRAALSAEVVRGEVACDPKSFCVSELDQLLVCRYLGASTLEARRAFEHVWALWRRATLEQDATPPRIWST